MPEKSIDTKIMVGLVVLILGVHFTATLKFWYPVYIWLDNPMHFAGGFWLGVLTAWFLERYRSETFIKENLLLTLLLVLGITALVGIAWEFLEFFYDLTISATRNSWLLAQPNSADTMKDLANNLLGASLFGVIYLFKVKRKKV